MESLILVTQTQLKELIKEVVSDVLKTSNKHESSHEPEELLTRSQTCEFLHIDSSTLWAWTKKGKVQAYGIANRRYYKKSELMNALSVVKVFKVNS